MKFLCRIWLQATAFIGLARLYFSPVDERTPAAIRESILRRFPDVRQLQPAELAAWMMTGVAEGAPLAVDARAAEEFEVSHLSGAIRFRNVAELNHHGAAMDRPIVVYCAMGYRGSALARRLMRAGFREVWNLEGGIFRWINEGRPVYRGREELPQAVAHPYNRKWSQLLKRGRSRMLR